MVMQTEIKHSALVITYNQEAYIEEAIRSILDQSVQPYEVVICDDCSTDNTWVKIQMYAQQVPHLIKAFRNEKNLGVFKNISKIRQLYTGDVITFCAGDDYLKPDLFLKLNEAISQNALNVATDRFIIVTNTSHLYPDGKETVWDNYKYRHADLFKLRLRYGLSYRNVGISHSLMKDLITEDELLDTKINFGYGLDFIVGFDEIDKCDRFVFIDFISSTYRLGCGVTKNIDYKTRAITNSNVMKYIINKYGDRFDSSDWRYIDFITRRDEYFFRPNIHTYIKAVISYMKNINNFSYNNPWIRNSSPFLPKPVVNVLKYRIYPLFVNIRNCFRKKYR